MKANFTAFLNGKVKFLYFNSIQHFTSININAIVHDKIKVVKNTEKSRFKFVFLGAVAGIKSNLKFLLRDGRCCKQGSKPIKIKEESQNRHLADGEKQKKAKIQYFNKNFEY